jgi:hypothetical protein
VTDNTCMAAAARRYKSYLNSPDRLARIEVVPTPARRFKLPEGVGGLQWAEEQQPDEIELDEDGRPVTPPPPLVIDLDDDSQLNSDVAAAINRMGCQRHEITDFEGAISCFARAMEIDLELVRGRFRFLV